MCFRVCTEVPNQIKFVPHPHPTGSRTDFTVYCIYRLWRKGEGGVERSRLQARQAAAINFEFEFEFEY
jgi:hypothetical protein